MTVKDYLAQIKILETDMADKMNEIRRLKPMLGMKAIEYSSDRVQTSPDGSGFTRIADRIADLEQEIVQCSYSRQDIIRKIESLPLKYSSVLFEVYVRHAGSIESAAINLSLSYGRVSHLHIEALLEFDKRFKVSKK